MNDLKRILVLKKLCDHSKRVIFWESIPKFYKHVKYNMATTAKIR